MWPKRKWVGWTMYVLLVLVGCAVFAAPFVYPYFATRPLSRDELIHRR